MNTYKSLAQTERQALLQTARQLGADHATLCSDWNVNALMTHLVVREQRPDGLLSVVSSVFDSWSSKVTSEIGQQGFENVCKTFESGAASWFPARHLEVAALADLVEFTVHHEDMRRAAADWQPRELNTAHLDALWKFLCSPATRVMFPRIKQGVTLHRKDFEASEENSVLEAIESVFTIKTGPDTIVMTGNPLEILLALYGRKERTVTVSGTKTAIARFEATY